jgi:cytochrome c-type biogenesis protein CcmH/NrfG
MEREKEVQRLTVEALDAFREKRYEKAMELAEMVLDLDPGNRRAKLLKKVIEDEQKLDGKAGNGNGSEKGE